MSSQIHRRGFKGGRFSSAALSVLLVLGMSACASSGGVKEKTQREQLADKDIPLEGPQSTTLSKPQKVLWFFSPYRTTIEQGNFISKEMVAQLKEGMTQAQVQYVLGTPLLRDIFHQERWDYPFSLKQRNGNILSSHVAVFFKEGKVVRVQSDNLPTEKEFINRIAGSEPSE